MKSETTIFTSQNRTNNFDAIIQISFWKLLSFPLCPSHWKSSNDKEKKVTCQLKST